MSEKVPWSAIGHYADGKLGHVGCCSQSSSERQAILDARDWFRQHQGMDADPQYAYKQGECRIEVNYRLVPFGRLPR